MNKIRIQDDKKLAAATRQAAEQSGCKVTPHFKVDKDGKPGIGITVEGTAEQHEVFKEILGQLLGEEN